MNGFEKSLLQQKLIMIRNVISYLEDLQVEHGAETIEEAYEVLNISLVKLHEELEDIEPSTMLN